MWYSMLLLLVSVIYWLTYGWLLDNYNPITWRGNVQFTFAMSLIAIATVFYLVDTSIQLEDALSRGK